MMDFDAPHPFPLPRFGGEGIPATGSGGEILSLEGHAPSWPRSGRAGARPSNQDAVPAKAGIGVFQQPAAGCSKMPGCKAPEVPMREAYSPYAAAQRDEGNAADGRYSATC